MPGSKMHVSGSPWFSKGLQTLFKTSKNSLLQWMLLSLHIFLFILHEVLSYKVHIHLKGRFPHMYLNLHHMRSILFKSSHNQPFQVISCATRRKFQLKLGTQMSPTCSNHTHCCPFKVGLK